MDKRVGAEAARHLARVLCRAVGFSLFFSLKLPNQLTFVYVCMVCACARACACACVCACALSACLIEDKTSAPTLMNRVHALPVPAVHAPCGSAGWCHKRGPGRRRLGEQRRRRIYWCVSSTIASGWRDRLASTAAAAAGPGWSAAPTCSPLQQLGVPPTPSNALLSRREHVSAAKNNNVRLGSLTRAKTGYLPHWFG
jgi:hypothetical protein